MFLILKNIIKITIISKRVSPTLIHMKPQTDLSLFFLPFTQSNQNPETSKHIPALSLNWTSYQVTALNAVFPGLRLLTCPCINQAHSYKISVRRFATALRLEIIPHNPHPSGIPVQRLPCLLILRRYIILLVVWDPAAIFVVYQAFGDGCH